MRVYFDNCIVSGEILSDLAPAEQRAVAELRRRERDGQISIFTSRESVREQARTTDLVTRQQLIAGTAGYEKVPRDHGLMPAQLNDGFINRALTDIVNQDLFAAFGGLGLKVADAKHLMYADENKCERFVTTDPDFLRIREELESLCTHARIKIPSDLVSELSNG